MVNPQTVNVGLIVPLTGADVDLWGANDINPNMSAVDGLFSGVQIISAGAAPITLTSPALFTPTPGGGPTQAQNRVLRFTGVLTANVTVTLPLPGAYIIENLTTGNFVLSFRGVTATEVIGTPQGERLEIYNDGANVRFVNLARMGVQEMWSGLIAMPAWVAACTVKPYLLLDGTVYNIADFPFLGGRYGSSFGGNGLTTFGVPDLQGRVPLAYDGTGTRITNAGCGINGQTLGAVNANAQSVTLVANQIPSITSVNAAQAITVNPPAGRHIAQSNSAVVPNSVASGVSFTGATTAGTWSDLANMSADNSISVVYTNASQQVVNNVQPAQVTGIWVVKT